MSEASWLTPEQAAVICTAVALGAVDVGGALSAEEARLVACVSELDEIPIATLEEYRLQIRAGEDPLGELFCSAYSREQRRSSGTVYTPVQIVKPMIDWVMKAAPDRVVDAGSGSGRYTSALLRRDAGIAVVAVDLDPIATLMTRAVGAVLGGRNLTVLNVDFTKMELLSIKGRTAFVGNPPYVRHHQLTANAKKRAASLAADLGYSISGLAGLHTHFYLATAHHARSGDLGCYVTSAEWLDVNYGSIVRNLLLGTLGASELQIVSPKAEPFEGTATTAALVQFEVGASFETVGFRAIEELTALDPLGSGTPIGRERLQVSNRWSVLTKPRREHREGYVELGELARVHRGAVTGANATWVLKAPTDLPDRFLFPSVTRARELFEAGSSLSTVAHLKMVLDLPHELDDLDRGERTIVDRFIQQAREAQVDRGYVAQNRRRWWAVGLKTPAPILATYMARRPPAFVRNVVGARHINIAHGLYPREPMSDLLLESLANSLRTGVSLNEGRTYAGGLTKFEPREMERLLIPNLAMLGTYADNSTEMD